MKLYNLIIKWCLTSRQSCGPLRRALTVDVGDGDAHARVGGELAVGGGHREPVQRVALAVQRARHEQLARAAHLQATMWN